MAKEPTTRRRATRVPAGGFPAQLVAFFAYAEAQWTERREDVGPRNAKQLAEWMRARGVAVNEVTARTWRDGLNSPGGRYIALLEALLGAPWLYLDNPANPAVTPGERQLFRARYAADPRERERAALEAKHLGAG